MVLNANTGHQNDDFANLDPQEAHFSQDQAWMQRSVLVAKHTVVWLAQLSRRYGKSISRLDQIPDEVLQDLHDRGFNGLWLLGLWQRSPASRKIKTLTGHPRADASAYAISVYEVAERLGGEDALESLRRRAAKLGIRLAADMVPNHTGMDASWMSQYPKRYISTSSLPHSQYSFTGPNLSTAAEIELYLEDHYLDQSDAAVVFKRVDTSTGEITYVYHGNDGVDTPWNDTAQLDFLQKEVRQAVIEQILDLAHRFPILRFDAAMTLIKKHFHRLWYPQSADTGNIESRKNFSLDQHEFDDYFPVEFWREAIERLRQESPDTLLIAESYWLTENYFAHTLGMHRVYNSAFMQTLAREANAEFRSGIKRLLAFDPRILARHLNYMSTPDEESVHQQFGDGDRYFGVATLLATLPGLPMFAHGQVEGLAERYAMDFAEPRLDESPKAELINQHLAQITPLLQRRKTFANADRFRLYDALDQKGNPVEDIIAFSNRAKGHRALIVYNNSPDEKMGVISMSAPFNMNAKQHQEHLVDSLDLASSEKWNLIEQVTGKQIEWDTEFLTKNGLTISLKAYQRKVFWEIEPKN